MGADHQIQQATPTALANSVYYPGNDPFSQVQNAVEHEIIDLSATMDRLDIEVAKCAIKGESQREIAKKFKRSQKTISCIRKKPAVIQLENYLNELRCLRDGPSAEIRKNMLWRIAVDNEKKDPKEATKAIAEFNKMAAPKGGHQNVTAIQIVVQNAALNRSVLDGDA